jgi:DNA-directed RNA polymerase specialized sigma24 family protein
VSESSDEGFEKVYREHGQRLWRAVFAYSGDPQIAQDAVSEAFAQALRRKDDIGSPLAWLYKASFRIAAGELKDRSRHSAPLPEVSYEMSGSSAEILSAVAQLSPKQRACVILCLYAGFSAREALR